jgi:GDSL-like lipase/acylhydrolase family protein
MNIFIAACLAGLVSAGAAFALDADICDVPNALLFSDAELNRVNLAVIKNRKLDIVVIGTGSSLLGGGDGADKSYPARLEAALRKRLPGVGVKVKAYVKPRQTTEDMAQLLDNILAEDKPDLLVWQAGTVDAIRGVDPDRFRAILDESVNTVRAIGSDVVLMNMQYSPRTETLIAVSPFADNMRWVANHRAVPVFDRLAVMRHWSDVGTFDLSAGARDFGLAQRVHDCIGRALAALILDAARLNSVHSKAPQ